MSYVLIPGVGEFERHSTLSPWGTEEQITYRILRLEPTENWHTRIAVRCSDIATQKLPLVWLVSFALVAIATVSR